MPPKPNPASATPTLDQNALAGRWFRIGVRWATSSYSSSLSHADIEELVDDAIIHTLRKLASRPGFPRPEALFFSTLRGQISNHLRGNRRRSLGEVVYGWFHQDDVHEGRHEQASSDLQAVLEQLPEAERNLVLLRFQLEMTQEEAAVALGLSLKKLRGLEEKAKAKIGRLYIGEVPDER